MVKISEIRLAIQAKSYTHLRALHDRAALDGIEDCDERMPSTVNLCMLVCSLFRDSSAGHLRSLVAMLDAIERGNHPYDDIIAMSTINAEAAIAQAQLDAMVSGK